MTDPTPPRPPHHRGDGRFRNPWPGQSQPSFADALRWMATRALGRRAALAARGAPPDLVSHPPLDPRAPFDECRITWIGHSSFLLQVGGINVLTDPVFSRRASPVQWMGPGRLVPAGIALAELPPIDLVVQSHDHYDHLDDPAVRSLALRFPEAQWCAPLGVAARLRQRRVREITECDWFDSVEPMSGVRVTCVPACHFSGRGPLDRDSTLWCGWVLDIGRHRVYFVGDSAHTPAFGEIGRRCGPFDVILMPIGAYDPRWFMGAVHLDPEDAVGAFVAVTNAHPQHATVMVGMHWGTFTLTDEPIDEPPRLARAAWAARALPPDHLWIMAPGETRGVPPRRC